MDGQILFSATNGYDTDIQVNLAHVPAGIYVVQVETEDRLPQILKWVRL